MSGAWPRFLPQGDAALVVEFGAAIDAATNARVLALAEVLTRAPVAGVVATVPTFRSLLLQYDPLVRDFADLVAEMRALLAALPDHAPPSRSVSLPVCYAAELAPDLADIAARLGLSAAAAAGLHAAAEYRVYMLGFLPGFAYMGGLPERLRLPRRATPRVRVPPRSVAIAMEMTAIYPLESPGGWHLIGAAPVRLFDLAADPPTLLRPGDLVRFRAVGRTEYDDLAAAAGLPT